MDQARAPLSGRRACDVMRVRALRLVGSLAAALASACAGSTRDERSAQGDLPYASEVVRFEVGAHGGFGMDDFPDVVLGPPSGLGTSAGSLDVLSLGVGGEIVLGFGQRVIVDGPGPDFVVFENAFWAGGDPSHAFVEPGEVAVSNDGEHFDVFPCDARADPATDYPGCAGVHPSLAFDPEAMPMLDPDAVGGDAFDLSDLGLSEARYVRITDRAESGEGQSAGFDLDAVGLVNYRSR